MLQSASTSESLVARAMCGVMASHFGRLPLMGKNLMMYDFLHNMFLFSFDLSSYP